VRLQAAYAGSIDLLEVFSHLLSAHVYTKAAEKGHLALLQWAKENAENNYPWPESKMFPAAAKCAKKLSYNINGYLTSSSLSKKKHLSSMH